MTIIAIPTDDMKTFLFVHKEYEQMKAMVWTTFMTEAFKRNPGDVVEATESVKPFMNAFMNEFPHEIFEEDVVPPFLKLTKVIGNSNPNGPTTVEILFPCADIKLISQGLSDDNLCVVYPKDGSSFVVVNDLYTIAKQWIKSQP